MKTEKYGIIAVVSFVALMLFVTPAMAAWGASTNVAAVDDENRGNVNYVYSHDMGYVNFPDFTTTMARVEPVNVNAATLANYDTLFLFACNPTVFSASQKADIISFVQNGGKLIIWDSEEPYPGTWDYSWLPTPFVTAVPGAMGAQGTLTIVEENMLSSNNGASPYFINAPVLSTNTDAVGDANVFTSFIQSQWCVDCIATNVLSITGPTHVYSDSSTGLVGDGIIIYNGLDWDYAGYDYIEGTWLKKMLQQEFDASTLPCGAPPPTNLDVTKIADKTDYNVGDTVTFTVTVTNPASNPYTASSVVLTDYPPVEVTLSQTSYSLGDIAPGASVVQTITGTARIGGACNIVNSVVATGYYQTFPVFTGSDSVTFNIECGTPVPEFSSIAIPIASILGLLLFVGYRNRKEEE